MSDLSIVRLNDCINWITSPSRRWSVFVANRVGEIQRLTKVERWRHIASPDNLADKLSRGINPYDLIEAERWWNGPEFLKWNEEHWPPSVFPRLDNDLSEQRKIRIAVSTFHPCIIDELLNKCSNLNKICRIIAYCLRLSKIHREHRISTFVSAAEVSTPLDCICRTMQQRAFREYEALAKNEIVNTSSNILSLSSYESGLMRVGRRLKNSNLAFNACHPILLPRKHILTQRIIEREHTRNLHAGLQATMAFVRQHFWLLSLRYGTWNITKMCNLF